MSVKVRTMVAYDVSAGENPILHGAQFVDVIHHGAAVPGRGIASCAGMQGLLAGGDDVHAEVRHVSIFDHIVGPAHTRGGSFGGNPAPWRYLFLGLPR
jgi:hypothetical protein